MSNNMKNSKCKDNCLLHLSTGDLLREEVSSGTPLGKEVDLIINSGELVSDEIVLSIVEKKLYENSEGWLLDGFPRTLVQAKALELLLKEINQPIDLVVLIELADEELIQRLLSRGRSDDNESVIRNRLAVYREKTEPLIGFYNEQGLLTRIQGEGSVEDIADRIDKAFV